VFCGGRVDTLIMVCIVLVVSGSYLGIWLDFLGLGMGFEGYGLSSLLR
jgi:hypothetical protein